MHSSKMWVWQQTEGFRWLQCQLLADWPHAFGCRDIHPHKPPQLAAQLKLPPQRAVWGHQVHGPDWIWADEVELAATTHHSTLPEPSSEDREVVVTRPQVDAIIARQGSDSAWVCTADCVPILVASREWVAAIHAGWRGTAARILPNVLQQFTQAGIPAEQIRIAIGPAISGAVYQVSEAVAEQVLQTLPPSPVARSALLEDPHPGKVRLDLRQVNQAQAQLYGIPPQHIALSPHCTLSQPQDFFSYRRDGSLKDEQGRHCVQWSGIGLRA
ncbi:peptidoglycan editing factor PgeF [Thermostichus vulcanus]|uniref:Purine nucleoside phosphorylase n=1 Tax=Thermostichus vulcanus str. 'Rupite' TaxID=2813851 RepID=A0ABT0CA19_THEVL|nr:peptidoglycan editing factor PgeF [Thermostichus vulcanus]MCJ2542623.1 peptidoglycan editing factor PgeF [Thermostichus vulcanus str. 'Rupite']